MDWLQFLSSVIGSLAWPLVVLVLLVLLRRHLGPLAGRLEELSLPGGAKAKFKEQLESGRQSAETVALDAPNAIERPVSPAMDGTFLELAKNYPDAAISQAWKEVEDVLLEIRGRLPDVQERSNLNSVVRRLKERGLIDGAAEKLFLNLRQARNTAVHAGKSARITTGEAVEYRDQVRVLLSLFRSVLERL